MTAIGLGALVPRPFSVQEEHVFDRGPETARRILILSNPIHTDIALPADPDVLQAFSFVSDAGLELDYPGVFWIVFGWGGRSFYIETPTWADMRPGPVIDAFTLDDSVMHVRRTGAISLAHASVSVMDLEPQAFSSLMKEIRASFESDPGASPEAIKGAAYDVHDIFFPARGGFNALVGCNVWTARMLRKAGLRTGFWTPLPATLRWSLDHHNGAQY